MKILLCKEVQILGNNNVFLTFIVPVYKVAYEQLHRCIHSLLEQINYTVEYEILLVDDGSPDECGNICDEYSGQYDKIRVIHQKNQGLSVVRNNGVNSAQGEWIAFVDGDDWVENDFVSIAEQSADRSNGDVDIFIWDGYAETRKRSSPIKFMDIDSSDEIMYSGKTKECLIDRILPRYVTKEDISKCTSIGITWGRIYKRKLLTDNQIENIPGLKVMQDSVFNLRAFEYANVISYRFVPIYHYSMYDSSVSKKYDSTISNTMCDLYRYFSEYITEFHDDEDYWQRLYVRTVRLMVKCLEKDYANPNNPDSFSKRIKKMKKDFDRDEFQTALKKCDSKGQDLKFKVILYLLKNKLYAFAIIISCLFRRMRMIQKYI